tara:strand:+ start:4518 stop:5216 length:699 start_codon:yes stop_codon:yes gene_type:complete
MSKKSKDLSIIDVENIIELKNTNINKVYNILKKYSNYDCKYSSIYFIRQILRGIHFGNLNNFHELEKLTELHNLKGFKKLKNLKKLLDFFTIYVGLKFFIGLKIALYCQEKVYFNNYIYSSVYGYKSYNSYIDKKIIHHIKINNITYLYKSEYKCILLHPDNIIGVLSNNDINENHNKLNTFDTYNLPLPTTLKRQPTSYGYGTVFIYPIEIYLKKKYKIIEDIQDFLNNDL